MDIDEDYFRGSLCIRPITQRSTTYKHSGMSINTKGPRRVLLSTMKSNAEHPCPRCLIKKIDTVKMGKRSDMNYRRVNMRIDDHVRRTRVEHARRLVFEQGIPLSSKHLKNVLGSFSGTPTRVGPTAGVFFLPSANSNSLECTFCQA
jgi:hypothetical protein